MAVDPITFVDERTTTASTTIDLGPWGDYLIYCRFILDVSNADTAAGDTFNLRIQSSMDPDDYRPIWDDFASFTQYTGTTAAGQEILTWNSAPTPETEKRAPADGTLAAGAVLQGPVGKHWRAKVTVVSADTPTFTWRLVGDGMFYK